MDPIVLTLRASKSPPASAPVGGELSSTEVDNNWTVLKTAAEQLDAEKLSAADAQEITATLTSLNGSDEFIVVRSGVAYKATLTTLRAFLSAAEIDPSLFTNTQIYYAPTVTQPSSGLSIVQNPSPTGVAFSTQYQQNLTAITSGNAVTVLVFSPSSAGAPTISDSAGGSWGSPVHTYAGPNYTARYYARANVTSGFTWVRATFGGNSGGYIAAVEVSGAGSSIVADATGGAVESASITNYTFPFTSTVANTLFMGSIWLSFGRPSPTGVAPITAGEANGGEQLYGRGIFPTAGSNTGQINISVGTPGEKSWCVFRPGP